jgi:hypothetical protein
MRREIPAIVLALVIERFEAVCWELDPDELSEVVVMTAAGAVVLLGRYMQMQTGHGLPGLMGQPGIANGANRNSRWSRPCIVQVPTCFVDTIWWSKSKVGNIFFFHLFFSLIYSKLRRNATIPFSASCCRERNPGGISTDRNICFWKRFAVLWLFQHSSRQSTWPG